MAQIRIIAGSLRGRKIDVISAPHLRPTADRLRETIFNWLQFKIANSTCLDAFAGSGAMGIEALSRGAKQVIFLETEKMAQKALQNTLQRFNLTHKSTCLQQSAIDYLNVIQNRVLTDRFDIIFIDPPFSQPNYYAVILNQAEHWLTTNGLIICEYPSGYSLHIPTEWQPIKHTKAGQSEAVLLQRRIITL